MTDTLSSSETAYIHGTAPQEQERLAALNRMNNPFFIEYLDLGGAQAILEVGCGMGILTEAVARAAPTATVVGIEQSEAQLARATQGESAPPNLRFVHGDAHHLGFEDDSFDVVYCRFVLEHLRDPVGALREMRRVTTSCGRVYAMENNIQTCDFDPDCRTFEAVWRSFAELQRSFGGDALIGKRLFRLFRMAGFQDVRLSIQPETHHSGQPAFEPWLRNLIGNVRSGERVLIERGLSSQEQVEGAVRELESLLQRDNATAHFYWNRAVGVK